jgi:hypothetical protein
MIDVTGVDLVKLAQKAYELSVPQGLGFLHARPGGLSESVAKALVEECKDDKYCALNMDYVSGRACKLVVRKDKENPSKLSVADQWYDHTTEQYKELLESVGVKANISNEHSPACNCVECQCKPRK